MCQVLTEHGLPIAPATYYAAKTGPPSPRTQQDEQLKLLIAALHAPELRRVRGAQDACRVAP